MWIRLISRDKIQNAAAAMRTPVRLEFSCYPEAELTNLLTDGKIDLILTGTRPDEAASHCPGTHFSRFHRFCFTHQPAPKPRIFPTFEMTPSSFPKPMPPLKSSQNLYPLFQDLGFAPKIRFAANLSTILDLTAQDEGVYLTHAWCRACKKPDYQMLTLPSTKKFYLACRETTQKTEVHELFCRLSHTL